MIPRSLADLTVNTNITVLVKSAILMGKKNHIPLDSMSNEIQKSINWLPKIKQNCNSMPGILQYYIFSQEPTFDSTA